MSLDEKVRHNLAYQGQKIENLQAEMDGELEKLALLVKAAIASKGYDSRIHEAALRLMEQDAALRALERFHAQTKAAVGVSCS